MIVVYIIVSICIIAGLSSVVPMIQYFGIRRQARQKFTFYFSKDLLDHEMADLSFENLDIIAKEKNTRLLVADRGWIRCPLGTVMDESEFEAKKEAEYLLDLP